MLHWALFFTVVSVIASFNGYEILANTAGNIGMYLAVLFVGLFVFSGLMSLMSRSRKH